MNGTYSDSRRAVTAYWKSKQLMYFVSTMVLLMSSQPLRDSSIFWTPLKVSINERLLLIENIAD